MSSKVPGGEWHAKTLRAWQLTILRFAVTLDNADRLAVLAIASEIDRLGPQHDSRPAFGFFRRTSAELCAAILRPNELSSTLSCANISGGLMTTASSVSSQQQSKPTNRRCLWSASLSSATSACGEVFPARGNDLF